MGIYANKIFAESEVEDSYNTPEEIGVDLDQVEADVMGPDGIEAHRDEVEDAVEGVVGDPMEECYYAMYESEYNFNQIMMNELAAYANKREVMTEAADIKGWFESVKNWIIQQFKSLMEVFNKSINKLKQFFDVDRHYADKFGKEITAGYDILKADGKTFKGYEFVSGDPKTVFTGKLDYLDTDMAKLVSDMGKKIGSAVGTSRVADDFMTKNAEEVKTMNETRDARIIKALKLDSLKVEKLSQVQDALVKYLFNGERVELAVASSKTLNPKDLLNRMKNNPVASIKKQYDEAKKVYKTILGFVENAKSMMLKNSDVNNNIKDYRIGFCNACIADIKAIMGVMYKTKCAYIKAYSARRAQDAAFAKACVSAYKASTKKSKEKVATTESFSFAIDFI